VPELPEVETTVRALQIKVLGRTFIDVWTDFLKIIRLRQAFDGQVKKPNGFEQFKKEIKGRKVQKIWRRGKNILFNISGNKILLIHQKLTGHLLFGKWQKVNNKWRASKGPLSEKINTYIHLLFVFDNGQMLALSDLRKFAKAELWNSKDLKKELNLLGPEPLEKNFTFEKFKQALKAKRGKIKQVLMDQKIIAGIGNIYSDEILFAARVHPLRRISELKEKDFQRVYKSLQKILKKAINLQGESISDYRTISGKKGEFDKERKVYKREGKECFRCGTIIKRIKIGGRSAYYCPNCQKS